MAQVDVVEQDLEPFLIRLGRIREEHAALRRGNYTQLSIDYHRPFIFQRELDGDKAIIIINATSNTQHVDLSDYMTEEMHDLLNEETIRLNEAGDIIVYPHWGRILCK